MGRTAIATHFVNDRRALGIELVSIKPLVILDRQARAVIERMRPRPNWTLKIALQERHTLADLIRKLIIWVATVLAISRRPNIWVDWYERVPDCIHDWTLGDD